jgi:hypothetical protein
MASQFDINAYMSNHSSSNYNGLLVTLDKNMSRGLRFEVNYTWAHSIDNYSEPANGGTLYSYQGIICDYTRPRACRGNSDFDIRQTINSNFAYALPLGRGMTFASSAPRWLDEAIGGWTLSGIPSYHTGVPVSATTAAAIASDGESALAIWNGTNKADLRTHVNVDPSTHIVYMFKGGATGASQILSEFSGPVGLQYGNRNIISGPGALGFDASLGKTFPIWDNLHLKFRADAFNVLNHPVFADPANTTNLSGGLNIVNNASAFGQLTGTTGEGPRVAQFSLRLEF